MDTSAQENMDDFLPVQDYTYKGGPHRQEILIWQIVELPGFYQSNSLLVSQKISTPFKG